MARIKRNTAYSVNDIVNTKFGIKLKCTTAGTTSTDPLILDGTSPITDGTVVWEVQEEQGGQGLVDYEANKSYNVGDIVIYDDKIYKCITAHISTNVFDDTKWGKIGDKVFTGATSSSSGEEGIVPQPTTSDTSKFLCGDGTWKSAGGSGGVYPDSYSTTEKLIGTWIDGKPLYRKVFENPSNPLDTGLTSSNSVVVNHYGYVKDVSSPTHYFRIPYADGGYSGGCWYDSSNGQITMNNIGGSGFIYVYVVVEYTKP